MMTEEMPLCRNILRSAASVLALAFCLISPGCRPSGGGTWSARVGADLNLLLNARGPTSFSSPAPRVNSLLTRSFYARRNYRPAWSDRSGILPQARDLVSALAESTEEGLDPCLYHWDEARAMIFQADHSRPPFEKLAARFAAGLDIVLTDAFLIYASHLADGKVNPEIGLAEGNSARENTGLVDLLENALAENQVRPALLSLRPQHEFYFELRRALQERRERLCGPERPLDPPEARSSRSRPDPVRTANAAVQNEIRTIILNMERWRWLPRFLGRRFVLIDVAGFRLILGEDGRRPMSMKVVVGNLDWPTPVFSALITGFILNPSWNCPKTIFYKETINYIKADRNYLGSNKMVILEGWGSRERELDAGTLDWSTVSPSTRPGLHLRQLPGPGNILGRLKFIMPNALDIYLHDTPYQDDFKQNARIFSHGCIRAEKPFDLAASLARNSRWTKENILAVIQGLEETTVHLNEPVPIHVTYCTAWPGEDGRVEFRPDVYGWDEKLAFCYARY